MKKGMVGLISAIGGAAAGMTAVARALGKQIKGSQEKSDKHLALFLMMNQWVKVKQEGKNLATYLEQKGYQRIAIYGMHYAGETLAEELKGSGLEIAYGIDKSADKLYADFPIVTPDSNLEEVDAVVVTSITFFEEIEEVLGAKISCPIISLEDVVYQV
ncbi:hypothetical protein C807_02835 [Lachnospiraceae bacterium 28-4]|nr:hypothetical protein C807_02835 [Lachnospiraceae bacterium 28-4]